MIDAIRPVDTSSIDDSGADAADATVLDALDAHASEAAIDSSPDAEADATPACAWVSITLSAPQPWEWSISTGGDYPFYMTIFDDTGAVVPIVLPGGDDGICDYPESVACTDCASCSPIDYGWCGACPVGGFLGPLSTGFGGWSGLYFAKGTCGSSGTTCSTPTCAPPGHYTAQVCAYSTPWNFGDEYGVSPVCATIGFDYPTTRALVGTLPSVVTYPVGGTLAGLPSGATLVLNEGNGWDNLTLNANGPFQFDDTLETGQGYEVAPATSPAGYLCTVTNGSGTVMTGPVSNIEVSCAAASLGTATMVSADDDACAVLTDGTVQCWGMLPTAVPSLTSAVAVANGWFGACALSSAGTASCWGNNASGELGNGTMSPTNTTMPATVLGLNTATALAAGDAHACALLQGGTVTCWGDNTYGQLGNGTTTASSTPVNVIGLTGALAITAGGRDTCALLATGGVACWGDNSKGQLGNGAMVQQTTATPVSELTGVQSVSMGGAFACAVLAYGSVDCWGTYPSYYYGQFPALLTPTPVQGLVGLMAKQVSVSGSHACALLVDSTVACWGDNSEGELGNDSPGNTVTSVPPVGGLSGVAQVATGNLFTCALLATGTIECWGLSFDTGTDSSTSSTVPAPVL